MASDRSNDAVSLESVNLFKRGKIEVEPALVRDRAPKAGSQSWFVFNNVCVCNDSLGPWKK
jgi:hypothetical protein